MHEQVAFGQKAGEQHAVPVLVGDLGDQAGGGLGAVTGRRIAQRPAVGAQLHPQLFLRGAGVGGGCRSANGQGVEGFCRAVFGLHTGLGHGGLQDAAVFAGERGFHRWGSVVGVAAVVARPSNAMRLIAACAYWISARGGFVRI